MIIFDIDIAISKNDMIIFEIKIAYVSNLAHPCSCKMFYSSSDQNMA
jgi:hypothetical protein